VIAAAAGEGDGKGEPGTARSWDREGDGGIFSAMNAVRRGGDPNSMEK